MRRLLLILVAWTLSGVEPAHGAGLRLSPSWMLLAGALPAQAVLNPFEPRPAAQDQKPAEADKPNPFAPKTPPPAGSGNPFAPRTTPPAPPKTTDPKPEPEPAPPAPPAELVVGAGWRVSADPATTPLAGVAPAPIPAPGTPASGDARRERTRYRVVTAAVSAPVVGLGLNEKEGDARDIWDLAANRKLGVVKGLALEGSRFMSLSPDGALFAAKPQFDDFVVVVNVATGKTQKTIPLAGLRLNLLAFSAPNRLVLAEDGRVVVHSLPDGRREREIVIDRWSVRDGWALSGGGRYLAALQRESIDRNLVTFVDLATGDTVGVCRLTGEPGDALGIAISRDGSRLAAVYDEGDGVRIRPIELPGPRRLPEFKVPASDLFSDDGYQGPEIEWLPDGHHLLVAGRIVVDVRASEIARTLPAPPPSPLVSIGPGLTLSFDGRELSELPLNLSIDRAALPVVTPAPVSPPGPVAGPALTEPDRSRSVAKTIGVAGRWDVRLAAPPAIREKLGSNGVRIPGGFVHQLLLTEGTPPVAVVSYAASPIGAGSSPDTASWVEVFDLETGNSRNRVDFGFPTVAASVSPGGKRVATLSQEGAGRIDVWSLEDDRHLGGAQPAGQRPDRQVAWFTEFIDQDHLLVAVADELSLWELPQWRQVYTLPIGPVRPALSPARDHAIVSVPGENRFAVVETSTGSVHGSVAASKTPGDRPMAAAFHHRGRWAAVLSGSAGSGEVTVIETDSGRDQARFRIPVTGDVLQYCDDEHLLIDGQSLVSLAKERVVWTYQLQTGLHSRDSLRGFHWYVAAVNPADRAYLLYGAALPEELAKKQIQGSTRTAPVVLRPTDSIRVDVVTADLAGPHIIKYVKDAFTRRYRDAGMTVAEDAQFAFVIDPGRMGVLRTSVWKVSLLQAGQTLWVGWIHGTSDGAVLLSTEPTGTGTRFADPPEVRTALAGLLNFDPPKFAFARGAALGDGTSQLTTSGPRPLR